MSPRQFLRRHFNKPPKISNHRLLGWIGHRLHDPELWHLGRRSVAGGVGLGLFLAFVPIPVQMLLAAPLALLLRVNLPISIAALWVSNPITMAPMMYFAYNVGGWITGVDTTISSLSFEPSLSALTSVLGDIWYPLSVGCFVCGISAAAVGNVSVRWLWRIYLLHRRRKRRRQKAGMVPENQRADVASGVEHADTAVRPTSTSVNNPAETARTGSVAEHGVLSAGTDDSAGQVRLDAGVERQFRRE